MSTTELSASPPVGKGDDQPAPEASQAHTLPPTDLPETPTQLDPSKESLQQNDENAESPADHSRPQNMDDSKEDSIKVTDSPDLVPPQPDPLAGQMEGLSVSAKNVSEAVPTPVSQANTPPPPPPPEKDDAYVNSTNPLALTIPSANDPTSAPSSEKELPDVPGDSDPESKKARKTDESRDDDNGSQPEIQSIMGQFQDPARTTDQQEIMSPRLELADQFRGHQHYFPPRKSSLEPVQPTSTGSTAASPPSLKHPSPASQHHHTPGGYDEPPAMRRQSSSSTVPPPPEPEPDQRFDFHRFLEQLRHRTADPVAKFLRSFLMEFGKRQWMVHEQVKIISDFLAFITNKMAICEVWRDVSDSEFDNAKEGMEKLVMNRLYSQTFAPAIPAPPTIPRSASRSRRREIERAHGPWRRGQHQEDIERDDILAQKIRIYSWVSEEHLDIPVVSGSGRRFLNLAQQGK